MEVPAVKATVVVIVIEVLEVGPMVALVNPVSVRPDVPEAKYPEG